MTLRSVLLLLGAASFSLSASAFPGEESPTNVVIITLDDIGTDLLNRFHAINPYGTEEGDSNPFDDGIYPRTPNLNRLADYGIVFLNAYSSPSCSPGRASLLTGCYPARHGIGGIVAHNLISTDPASGPLHEFGDPGYELPTLGELARTVGVQSAAFGKWHLGLHRESSTGVGTGWGGVLERGGWDEFHCVFSNLNNEPDTKVNFWPWDGYLNFWWGEGDTTGWSSETVVTDEYVTSYTFEAAKDFCTSQESPFLAYIALNAGHSPFNPQSAPPASENLVLTNTYLPASPDDPEYTAIRSQSAMIEAFDTELGGFIDHLDSEQLLESTLILVMGDNGTAGTVMKSLYNSPPHNSTDSGDRYSLGSTYEALIGVGSGSTHANGLPLFKGLLFEKGIRVPLIAFGAGVAPSTELAPHYTDALVDVVDIYPTIRELWGAAPSQGELDDIDGISFLSVLQDPSIGLEDHARSWTRSEHFSNNGDIHVGTSFVDAPTGDSYRRMIGYSSIVPNVGRYKIVRTYDPAVSNRGQFTDEFFLLEDLDTAGGDDSDPWELVDLLPGALVPGSEHSGPYQTLVSELVPQETVQYCLGNEWAVGSRGDISLQGSNSVAVDDATLRVDGAAAGKMGLFLVSEKEVAPPYTTGRLCLESWTTVSAATTNSSGILQHNFRPSQLPGPAIVSGSTRKFQALLRTGIVTQSIAVSGALSVMFVP